MADPNSPLEPVRPTGGLFQEPVVEKRSPTALVAGAVAVLLLLIGLASLFLGKKHPAAAGSPDTLRPVAAYAPQLKFSGLALSESTSISGGKSTFLDGHITNTGSATVSGITVQVLFASDAGAPQLETTPVSLVRTRQPYLDTEPVSAAPLAPGTGADFRLIFEGIRPEWNQQMPEIHVVDVATR